MSFINYILKKIFYVFFILMTVIFLSFFVVKIIPGNPVDAMFGQKSPSKAEREMKERKLGLDKSTSEQLTKYLSKISKLTFEQSFYYEETTLKLFWEKFQITFLLAISSCFLGSFIGIFFGSLSSLWQNNKKSVTIEILFLILFSTPTFIIGFILQYYLAYRLEIFSISGSLALPILTLSLMISGSIFKITHNNMVETLKQPYIITAYAKGLSTQKVVFKHALKNALIPILAQIGLIFIALISGTVITEYIFNLSGVGKLIMKAFEDRDYPVLQCCIILLAVFISIFNLLLDLIYFWLNPKISHNA